MIKSMTGYGLGTAANNRFRYSVEIKSLNSKFLELNMRLPKAVADQELLIRGMCSRNIERGKVNIQVTVEYMDQTANAANINRALFLKYYEELKSLTQLVGSDSIDLFKLALQMPEVVSQQDDRADEEEASILMGAFQEALKQFDIFRKDEGNVLKEELASRSSGILELLAQVEAVEANRIPLVRERLTQYLDKAVGKENVDQNRFEQELIYYIDKLDITEEKVRLRSHCNYFAATLEGTEGNGKKLGFISQEIGREVNTLGSKANDAGIQQTVIRMKEELEKIKEQLLNVL